MYDMRYIENKFEWQQKSNHAVGIIKYEQNKQSSEKEETIRLNLN